MREWGKVESSGPAGRWPSPGQVTKRSHIVALVDDDQVFKALSCPTRRHLLDALFATDGQTLGELSAVAAPLSRFATMKHLGVLEEAGLVVTRRRGRQKLHSLNPIPIAEIARRWLDKYTASVSDTLLGLRDELEARATATNPERSAS